MMTRLVKLTTGELVIGMNHTTQSGIKDAASVIINDVDGEISVRIAPINMPLNDEIADFIHEDNIIYDIKHIPQELDIAYANFKLAKNKQLIFSILLAYLLQATNNTLTLNDLSKVLNIDDSLTLDFLKELSVNGLVAIEDDIITLTKMGIEQAKEISI